MKFLIITHRFHTNLFYRTKSLADAGNEVKILALYKGKSEYYNNFDIKFLKLSFCSKIFLKTLNFFKKNHLKTGIELRIQSPNKEFKKEIQTFKPDVIILKAYQNMLALKTLFIAKRLNIKVLMLTQTTFTHIKGSKFLFELNIKFFKFLGVHAYITPIKSNYDAFKNFGIENIFYLPFVFIANKKVVINKNFTSKIKIISVGKFVKRKDHLLLIKSVYELIKLKFDIELNIYGEKADKNYLDVIASYIDKYNLKQKINIFKNIPYKLLLNEYSEHDIFVLPSYSEPAAYSIVEALANGLPVLCSDECGTKCYIIEGETGYIFEAKNMSDLTKKILLLISDRKKLSEFSENALLSGKENHNTQNFNNSISEIIKLK